MKPHKMKETEFKAAFRKIMAGEISIDLVESPTTNNGIPDTVCSNILKDDRMCMIETKVVHEPKKVESLVDMSHFKQTQKNFMVRHDKSFLLVLMGERFYFFKSVGPFVNGNISHNDFVLASDLSSTLEMINGSPMERKRIVDYLFE